MGDERIREQIVGYWTKRAESYGALNREELKKDRHREAWLAAMEPLFPPIPAQELRILDIGTGPGFFAVLLAQAGYRPDAVDCTEEMLKQARANAGDLSERITFHRMNADHLDFADDTFDVIVCRNLTWNLPDPCICYAEWKRVLKPGGRAIIFDANWYHYLYDEQTLAAYERDRENVAKQAIRDFNIGENFDVMERIAKELPMSKKPRPAWDRERLLELGYAAVDVCEDIWKDVWTEEEKINYAATPMFRITATAP
ncbi:MAG: methyltransferase domain-containing protein [Lachnospiraceae bacterium]|nr:methyltransferase domain-containing protein [Lachnospiraceae bacterium]